MRVAGTFVRSRLRGLPGTPGDVDPEALAQALAVHRVGPTLDHLLRTAPDAEAVAPLRVATRPTAVAQAARQLPVQLDLKTVSAALQGLPWAVLKGPAVAKTVHGGAPREFHDLDVLVSPAAFGDALRELEALGAQAMDPDWAGIRAARAGEIAVALPHGTFLDLHWHLVNRPARRQRFTIDVDALLDRSRVENVLGTDVPVLDATDQLHHLALHACLSGAWRLLWSYDLRLASAATDAAGWDELCKRTAEAGTGLPVALALGRARQVLDAAVAPRVLRRLTGSSTGTAWLNAATATTLLRPPHALSGPTRNGAVLYQSTAADGLASLGVLTSETRRRLARAEGSKDFTRSDQLVPDRTVNVTDREQYLLEVANEHTR